ncbi:hypothetical protein ACHAWF_011429 [Thalassiosira exigua]
MPLICQEMANAGLDPPAGCIFYCGFGENLVDAMALQRDTLLREVRETTGPTGWVLRKIETKDRLERRYETFLEKVNADDEPDFVSASCGLSKQPAKWMQEHLAYDAREALAKYVVDVDCLAITGRKDFQVRNEFCDPAAVGRLVPRARSVEGHRPAKLTHALRSTDGQPSLMNMKRDYARMSEEPLDAELLAITDAWCDRVLFGRTIR